MKKYLKKKYLYLYRKIVREKASPEYIARGWAIGIFYGCLFPFGTQLFFSIPTAFLLKGSKIGAVIGTLITNHFTIFVIYPVQCYLGAALIGRPLTYSAIKNAMAEVLREQDWASLMHLGGDLVAAFFVGGLVFAAFMTPLAYFFVKSVVEKYRKSLSAKKGAARAI